MKKFLLIILSLYTLIISVNSYGQTPQNPLLQDESIYLSDQGVYKISLNDLSIEWSVLTSIQTFEPVLIGDLLVVGSTQGLYAFNSATGKIIWHIEVGHTLFSPAVFDNHLYVGSLHGDLYDISLADGKINWITHFSGWIYSPVVMSEQNQLWTGGQAHQAVSVDMHQGNVKYQIALSQEVIFSPLKISSQTVAYNLFDGSSVFIDVALASISNVITGSTQAQNLLKSGGVIYRSSREGSLAAFTSHSSKVDWQQKIFDSGLTVKTGLINRLLLSDEDQWLMLFDSQQKKILWKKKIQGNWFLPLQLSQNRILIFYRNRMNLKKPVAVILDTTHKK